MGSSLHGSSAGQPGVGSSTMDYDRWLKGALEVERLSLWELCEGKLEGGLAGDPERYVLEEKALETSISLHMGPTGEHGRGLTNQRL